MRTGFEGFERFARLAVFGFLVLLVAAPGAAAPPTNEDCLTCHDSTKPLAGSMHEPLSCVDCHADLAKVELPHEPKVARAACASCHDDIGGKYHDSIHAWAKEKAGLSKAAPACADCHGSHDIKAHTDKASRVFREAIPATCGACHTGIHEQYDKGIHAAALKKGNGRAPVCIDCHTAHAIQRTDSEKTRLSVTAQCGTCHSNVVDSFRRTFHGKVTELGFTQVAACADCHGAHGILPKSDPASMVAADRLVETCGRCHPGANAQFVKYDPHPNPRDYRRSAVLWWANRFYWILIPGCFGFFGLHSALWFWRSTAREEKRS